MRFPNNFFLPAIYLFAVLYMFAAYGLPILKYHNVIDWSWWWISLPWWGGMIAVVVVFFMKARSQRHVSDALMAIALKSYTVGYCTRQGYRNPFGGASGEIKTDAFHCTSKDKHRIFKWRDLEISWDNDQRRNVVNRSIGKSECDEMLKECLDSLEKK